MKQKYYRITELARKASVYVRMLRYYDQLGLLVPAERHPYRLYTDEDLIRLQYILSLKLLGFSLKEIKEFLRMDAEHFKNRLAQQKAVLKEKIVQINNVIETIENVESALTSNQIDIGAMVRTIQVTQMRLKAEWIKKYLTAEERKTMRELVHQSYSKEALLKLAAKGWTVKDDPPHIQYKIFRERLTDLVNEGIRPDHPEAQKLAKMLMEMNHRLSQDDPSIKEGMKKAWEIFNSLPEAKKPKMYAIPAHERAFLKAACIHYHKNRRKQG